MAAMIGTRENANNTAAAAATVAVLVAATVASSIANQVGTRRGTRDDDEFVDLTQPDPTWDEVSGDTFDPMERDSRHTHDHDDDAAYMAAYHPDLTDDPLHFYYGVPTNIVGHELDVYTNTKQLSDWQTWFVRRYIPFKQLSEWLVRIELNRNRVDQSSDRPNTRIAQYDWDAWKRYAMPLSEGIVLFQLSRGRWSWHIDDAVYDARQTKRLKQTIRAVTVLCKLHATDTNIADPQRRDTMRDEHAPKCLLALDPRASKVKEQVIFEFNTLLDDTSANDNEVTMAIEHIHLVERTDKTDKNDKRCQICVARTIE